VVTVSRVVAWVWLQEEESTGQTVELRQRIEWLTRIKTYRVVWGFGDTHNADASKSLSVHTLCPDYYYRMPDFPHASGPIVYVVDFLRGNGLGAHRWLSKYLTRKVYGRRKRTTSWSSKGCHRMSHLKRAYLTEAESMTRWKAPFRL
jgi:hypothetical protein